MKKLWWALVGTVIVVISWPVCAVAGWFLATVISLFFPISVGPASIALCGVPLGLISIWYVKRLYLRKVG